MKTLMYWELPGYTNGFKPTDDHARAIRQAVKQDLMNRPVTLRRYLQLVRAEAKRDGYLDCPLHLAYPHGVMTERDAAHGRLVFDYVDSAGKTVALNLRKTLIED